MIIRLVLILALGVLCGDAAHGQPPGQYPQSPDHYSDDHWYPAGCCTRRDCRPVDTRAVSQEGGGYRIHYVDDHFGSVDIFVSDDGNIQDSRDGRYHICLVWNKPKILGYRCFFRPTGES